jgi:cytochrome c oxidase subunit 4
MSGEAEHKSHTKEYVFIFFVLTVLTLIELWIPSLKNLSTFAKGSALTVLAVGKAFIVAFWYMHLKEEKAWLKWIAAIPISAALYALMVCLESVYR